MQSQSDLAALARVLSDGSLNARDMADARRAQLLAEQANDPRALAQTHNTLGILARSREETPMAIAAFERSLAYARSLDDPSARAAASNNLALALADHGEHARAQTVLDEALALCVAQGDRHREVALHNHIQQPRARRPEQQPADGVARFAQDDQGGKHRAHQREQRIQDVRKRSKRICFLGVIKQDIANRIGCSGDDQRAQPPGQPCGRAFAHGFISLVTIMSGS